MRARDGFAGIGWGIALRQLGIEESAIELDPDARATRLANGMSTDAMDMWAPESIIDDYDIGIDSPPCQTFSQGGKGTGRAALADVLNAIDTKRYYSIPDLQRLGKEVGDERTALVLTPLYYAFRDRPESILMEQVPSVLPVWMKMAEVLRANGYSAWAGVLNAEQYGVPQTRRRAILIARKNAEALPPKPTHSRYYSPDPQRFDEGVLPWVSWADGIGWGLIDKPSHTLTAGTHGAPDPWLTGGRSVREAIKAKIGTDAWRGRGLQNRPSPTIMAGGIDSGGAEPIMKINRYRGKESWTGSEERLSVAEAAVLQSFPASTVWPTGDSKAFRIIGNAVPPLLAKAVIESVL